MTKEEHRLQISRFPLDLALRRMNSKVVVLQLKGK